VGLVLLEAVSMVALTVVLVALLATSRREAEVGFTYAEIGLCVLVVLGLAWGASALRRERHWPRSMLITLELVGLAIAGRTVQYGHWWIGVPALAVILATLVLLFVTAAREER
jgi:hypothetical protein